MIIYIIKAYEIFFIKNIFNKSLRLWIIDISLILLTKFSCFESFTYKDDSTVNDIKTDKINIILHNGFVTKGSQNAYSGRIMLSFDLVHI